MIRVLYNDEHGRSWAQDCVTEEVKNNFINVLENTGIKYTTVEVADKTYQIVQCAFKLEDVVAKRFYTFADPDELAKKAYIVTVKLENGEEKPVYVNMVCRKTIDEIRELANSLGRKKLCRVIGVVSKT